MWWALEQIERITLAVIQISLAVIAATVAIGLIVLGIAFMLKFSS